MEFIKNTKIELENGSIFEGSMSIKFEKGKMTYKNGDIYEGSLMGSKRNGLGKMVYKNGDIYDGEWNSDKFYGNGTITYVNGNKVIFMNSLKENQNIIITKNINKSIIQFMQNNKIIEKLEMPDCIHNIDNFTDLKNIVKNEIVADTFDLSNDEFEILYCPISLNIMSDPIITSCGHTFCKKSIDKCDNKCPLCREQILYYLANNDIIDMLHKINFKFLEKQISYHDFKTIENIKEIINRFESHKSGATGATGGYYNPNNVPDWNMRNIHDSLGRRRQGTGDYNTAIGNQALYTNTTGIQNTAIGNQALFNNSGNTGHHMESVD
jgi:hypothetical protein